MEKTISHKKNNEVKNNDRSRNHKNDKIENDKSGIKSNNNINITPTISIDDIGKITIKDQNNQDKEETLS